MAVRSLPARVLLAALLPACADPPAPPPATTAPAPVPAAPAPARPSSWISLQADADRTLADQLTLEIKAARSLDQTPIVYIAAAWCGPCVAIKKLRRDPRLLAAIQGAYVIELDVDEWKWADLEAHGFTPREVPYFYRVDPAGRSTGQRLGSAGWGGDVPNLLPAPLAALIAAPG